MSASDATLSMARDTTRRVARTFALACRLLPRSVRDDVYRLYLVFRILDDLVDFGDADADADARVGAVEAWCAGGPAFTQETEILASLDERHDLPRDALLDFCRGMRDDLAGTPVSTEDELETYCYRVAGTVGVVMTAILGTRPGVAFDDATPAAAALGKAMQRTNILRDIDEDMGNGRIYLAAETIERFGSLEPGCREALLRDQIARADELYDEGLAGVAMLGSGRIAIRAAAGMYREILRQIEREGYGAQAGRVVVPRSRKLLVAARSATV